MGFEGNGVCPIATKKETDVDSVRDEAWFKARKSLPSEGKPSATR
jgi:hypothetical protein